MLQASQALYRCYHSLRSIAVNWSQQNALSIVNLVWTTSLNPGLFAACQFHSAREKNTECLAELDMLHGYCVASSLNRCKRLTKTSQFLASDTFSLGRSCWYTATGRIENSTCLTYVYSNWLHRLWSAQSSYTLQNIEEFWHWHHIDIMRSARNSHRYVAFERERERERASTQNAALKIQSDLLYTCFKEGNITSHWCSIHLYWVLYMLRCYFRWSSNFTRVVE